MTDAPDLLDKAIEERKDALTLYDLNRYFASALVQGKRRPVIGNEGPRMTAVLLFGIAGQSIMVRGEAGSGKTQIINAIVSLLWGDAAYSDGVDEVLLLGSASDKGLLTEGKAKRIHDHSTHCVIPELQNAENHEAMIKLWAEDKPFVYDRAIYGGMDNQHLVLDALPMLTSIADENRSVKEGFINDELERRFIQVWTDSSRAQNRRIIETKAKHRGRPASIMYPFDEVEIAALRRRVRQSHAMLSGKGDRMTVVNPFAEATRKLLPDQFTVSNTLIEYLFDLVEAIAMFNWDRRVRRGRTVFASVYDNWAAWEIAGRALTDAALRLSGLGREIMDILPHANPDETFGGDLGPAIRGMTVAEIRAELDKRGLVRTNKQILSALGTMVWTCYAAEIEGRSGGHKTYVRTADLDKPNTVEWAHVFEAGLENVREYYAEAAEEFESREKASSKWTHPLTGATVELLEHSKKSGVDEWGDVSDSAALLDDISRLAYNRAWFAMIEEETFTEEYQRIQIEVEETYYQKLKEINVDISEVKECVKNACKKAKKDREESAE